MIAMQRFHHPTITCTYVALVYTKEVYSQLDINELKRLMPLQNNEGSAAVSQLCPKVDP